MSFRGERFTRESAVVSINKGKFVDVIADILLFGKMGQTLDKRGDSLVRFGGYVTDFTNGLFGGSFEANYRKHEQLWKLLLRTRGFRSDEFTINRRTPFSSDINQLHISFRL